MTSKTTFYHVRRSSERGYEGSALPVDCLYAFENKDAAVKAAKASAHLTMSRYTGHHEKANTMSDGSFDVVFETATYTFHVESFEMPSSREPRVIVNGKREMYALVCDHMIDSFHWTKSQANNTLNEMIKEIDGMQLDSGDLVEAVEVGCEYNEGLIRYQVQTVMNPNEEVYTENYGKDEGNKEDWFSCKLETIELVRVPVDTNAWSDKVVKNGGFTWHWTEFQGGVAGSFESVLDWLK